MPLACKFVFALGLGLLDKGFEGGGRGRRGWEGGREEKNNRQATFILVQNSCARGYQTGALHQVYVERRAALDAPSNEQEHCTLIEHLSIAFVAFPIKEINVYHNRL